MVAFPNCEFTNLFSASPSDSMFGVKPAVSIAFLMIVVMLPGPSVSSIHSFNFLYASIIFTRWFTIVWFCTSSAHFTRPLRVLLAHFSNNSEATLIDWTSVHPAAISFAHALSRNNLSRILHRRFQCRKNHDRILMRFCYFHT